MKPILLSLACLALAAPAAAQTLSEGAVGVWDTTPQMCRAVGTSPSQVTITSDRIDTYGGDALVTEVEVTGPVTYVAAQYRQTEGVETVGPRKQTYYRLTQRDGTDRLNFIWQGVTGVDLVRCDPDARPASVPSGPAPDQPLLPIPQGLWVIAGSPCDDPEQAAWRFFDGQGLFGADSSSCAITDVDFDGADFTLRQTCTAAFDGSITTTTGVVERQAPYRIGLIENGAPDMIDFNWCAGRERP